MLKSYFNSWQPFLQVGLGSLGVVAEMTLKCTESHDLRLHRFVETTRFNCSNCTPLRGIINLLLQVCDHAGASSRGSCRAIAEVPARPLHVVPVHRQGLRGCVKSNGGRTPNRPSCSHTTASMWRFCACLPACLPACVRAYVRACLRMYVCLHARALAKERKREKEIYRGASGKMGVKLIFLCFL